MALPRLFSVAPWLLALAGASGGGEARALEPGAPPDEYVRAAWPSVAHASAVRALATDRSGYLWIGTSEGLVRFDGQSMRPFDGEGAAGIVTGNIERVFEASDGALWVGSRTEGLSRLAGTARTWLQTGDGLPSQLVRAFAETADGTIWVATFGGVARLRRGSLRPQPASAGLVDPRVDSLAVDSAGVLWAGTRGGLFRWQPERERWQPERSHPAAATRVHALLAAPDGALWVGTVGAGLLERRGAGWRAYAGKEGLGSDEVSALLRERGGRLWVATRNGGLAWLAGQRFQRFAWSTAECERSIDALAEDAEGGLWIGTESCGLHRLHDRPIGIIGRRDGLPSDAILGLQGGPDGSVWLGTRDAGMARIPPGARRAQPVPWSLPPGASCWDLAPEAGGSWAVCTPSDLLRWNGTGMAHAALPPGLDAVEMVMRARDGAVWLAHGDRVVRWQGGTATRLAAQERLSGKRVPYQGPSGTVWIAADDGVAVWRDGVERLIRFPAGTAVEASNLLEDGAGALWIGTKGAGVRLVRGDRVASIGPAQGLPTGWIVQILEDDGGRLWMTSGKGLVSVPRRELEELADGRRARILPDVYDGADGVLMRTEPFGHPAGWKGPDGRLWFATLGGIAVVDPATLRAPPPRVTIEEVRVNGRPTSGSALGTGPRDLEVAFAARSFAAPETVLLRHRLQGRDSGWIEAGAGRNARYPQLEPGRYRLVVSARHRDGAWGGDGASLELHIRQPFHRSPWFALAAALAGALLLFAAHRVRLTHARAGLQAVMAERARIARDLHDTLAQAFVATSVRLECLDHALESADRATMRRHLEAARSVVKLSLEEARRAVWVLRPQGLEQGLPAAFETLVGGATGDTRVELEVLGTPRPLAPTVEANLLRIAQEGVSNAYRHARAQRIALRLAFHARAVEMSVSDDGTGLGSGRPVERGLAGMKERAADIGGTLMIQSRPGGGTAIRVEVQA